MEDNSSHLHSHSDSAEKERKVKCEKKLKIHIVSLKLLRKTSMRKTEKKEQGGSAIEFERGQGKVEQKLHGNARVRLRESDGQSYDRGNNSCLSLLPHFVH